MTSTQFYLHNIQNQSSTKQTTGYDVETNFINNLSKDVVNELVTLNNIKDPSSKQKYAEIMDHAHLKLMQRYYNQSKVNDFTVKQIENTKNNYIKELQSVDRVMKESGVANDDFFLRNFKSLDIRKTPEMHKEKGELGFRPNNASISSKINKDPYSVNIETGFESKPTFAGDARVNHAMNLHANSTHYYPDEKFVNTEEINYQNLMEDKPFTSKGNLKILHNLNEQEKE